MLIDDDATDCLTHDDVIQLELLRSQSFIQISDVCVFTGFSYSIPHMLLSKGFKSGEFEGGIKVGKILYFLRTK